MMRLKRIGSIVTAVACVWTTGYLVTGPTIAADAIAEDKAVKFAQADIEFFEKKIRPVLISQCYKCHGGEVNGKIKIQGGLDLTTREGLLKGGDTGPSIVPGDLKKSVLFESILYENEDLEMPPKGKMKDAIIADFKKWIERGAADPRTNKKSSDYQEDGKTDLDYDFKSGRNHWAYQKMSNPSVPRVKDPSAVNNAIDQFVQHKLEAAGIKPNGKASKRQLIRRATFDLIGLPPTEAEIQAFLDDKSPKAFEKVVDRLLASPHYGERIGRHWLDVARYSDSNGLDENTAFGRAFEYRDYVIRSFNQDKPYNVFVTEQIAGDLMPTARKKQQQIDQLVGTSFLCLGPKVLAEPDKEKMRIDIVDEQIDVMGKAFMGQTISCSRCHDHKFDPIPTWDYYALAGVFKSTRVMQTYNTVAKVIEMPLLAGDDLKAYEANKSKLAKLERDRKSFVRKTNQVALKDEYKKIGGYLAAAALDRLIDNGQYKGSKAFKDIKPKTNLNLNKVNYGKFGIYHTNKPGNQYLEWTVDAPKAGRYRLQVRYASGQARPMALSINGKVVKEKAVNKATGGYDDKNQKWFAEGAFSLKKGKNVIRLESNTSVPHLASYVMVQAKNEFTKRQNKVVSKHKLHQHYVDRWAAELKSNRNGQFMSIWRELSKNTQIHKNTKTFKEAFAKAIEKANSGKLKIDDQLKGLILEDKVESLEDLGKVYQDVVDRAFGQGKYAKGKKKGKPGQSAQAKAIRNLLESKGAPFGLDNKDKPFNQLYAKKDIRKLHKFNQDITATRKKVDSKRRLTMRAVEDKEIKDLPVHIRGNHTTLSKTRVPKRGFLRVTDNVVKQPLIEQGKSGRLELAKWLTDKEHPLTARVMVNRIWGWHFGKGIVSTPSNFGIKGAKPTHPELLDYLSRRFVEGGWSVKKIHKLIMMSQAYQRSSAYSFDKITKNPTNSLIWRRDRKRLEAEIIRDTILATSGELDLKIGGSLLKSASFRYVTNDQSRLVENFKAKRRAVYLPVIRNAQYSLFSTFDYPDPAVSLGSRPSTVVSHQALFMMNSPLVIEASQAFAKLILKDNSKDDHERIRSIYVRAFGREPSAEEVSKARSFVQEFAQIRMDEKVKREQAQQDAWAAYCHVMMASSEFIYID